MCVSESKQKQQKVLAASAARKPQLSVVVCGDEPAAVTGIASPTSTDAPRCETVREHYSALVHMLAGFTESLKSRHASRVSGAAAVVGSPTCAGWALTRC